MCTTCRTCTGRLDICRCCLSAFESVHIQRRCTLKTQCFLDKYCTDHCCCRACLRIQTRSIQKQGDPFLWSAQSNTFLRYYSLCLDMNESSLRCMRNILRRCCLCLNSRVDWFQEYCCRCRRRIETYYL
jgi:hypothetical protein